MTVKEKRKQENNGIIICFSPYFDNILFVRRSCTSNNFVKCRHLCIGFVILFSHQCIESRVQEEERASYHSLAIL